MADDDLQRLKKINEALSSSFIQSQLESWRQQREGLFWEKKEKKM